MEPDPPPDRPDFGPGTPGYGPDGQPPPGPPPAAPPYAPPATPAGPEAPAAPPAPRYGGPVPPGGWEQSPAPQAASPPPRAPLASWGSRLAAYVIDGLVVLVPVSIVFFLLLGGALGLTGTDDEDTAVGAAILAFLGWLVLLGIVSLLYAPLLMARSGERNGQTWGKQLIGIRAVRNNGQPWGFGSAALREVVLKNLAVMIASSIIPVIPWFLNFFWPLWDDENRALHDMAAESHVVTA